MSMKIAIVGAGIGGLAVALAVAQAGFTVEVYERAPALLDQGAGITMAPNATRVLFHIGLEPALLSTAAAPPATEYRHYRTGFVFKRIDHQGSRERFGYPHLRFHRWDLQEAMVRQLNLIAPGALRLGWRLDGLALGDRSVELSFADGRAVTADLVVGADGNKIDGPRSPVRSDCGKVYWLCRLARRPSAIRALRSFGEFLTG